MSNRRGHASPLLLALFVLFAVSTSLQSEEPFEREIAPILRDRCLACHSGESPKGKLDLTHREAIIKGGRQGTSVVPGQASESLLYQHVLKKTMPPKQPLEDAQVKALKNWIDDGAKWSGPKLSPPRAGADWWSLQAIRRPAVPKPSRSEWVRNPIDALILAKLEASKLSPSPEADRRTYIRRVSFNLTGLPPTPEEVEAFLGDRSPDAYEKLVDRLLASPAYGERWGRHWLDVVRFAESHGYEMNTLRPNAWPYRDYIIAAFNEDRPFPRFVREQLAGDLAVKDDPLGNVATGFIVAGPHDMVGNATKEGKLQQRADDLADIVSNTATTFLGLTVGCARCHDHKFDPISQKEYYSLQAVFAGVEHAERPMSGVQAGDRREEIAELRKKLHDLDQQIDAKEPLAGKEGSARVRRAVQAVRNLEHFTAVEAKFVRFTITATNSGAQPCLDELEIYGTDANGGNLALASTGAKATAASVLPGYPIHQIVHLNDGGYGNSRSWISNKAGNGWAMIELPKSATIERVVWSRDREGRYADRVPSEYRVEVSRDGKEWQTVAGSWDRLKPDQTGGADAPKLAEELKPLFAEQKSTRERLASLERPTMAYAGKFRAPDKTHLLKRGDPLQPGDEITPGMIAAIKPVLSIPPSATDPERRSALADWIASKENPLPARVMVNRLWHWHFGQGIVRTPSDFGYNGGRPSHPELLDWLATEYQSNGWKLKPLHRLIVLSATYRQSSRVDERSLKIDAENRMLWRYSPRRLEAEAIRDSLLQVSGALNPQRGGPGYHLWDYSGYVIVFTPKKTLGPAEFRRMVYQFKPRLQQDGIFGAFDCPDATAATPRRDSSTTALQALNLLNDPFILDQSERFAIRVRKEAGADVSEQIRLAFRLAFNREPTEPEMTASAALVKKHGLAPLGRALFNANEFVYVE